MELWSWFRDAHPVFQAGLAGGFTWLLTMAGAAIVLFFVQVGRVFLDAMLGFAAGVMLAASVWSLLIPAIERSAGSGLPLWLPPATGFALGGLFLFGLDRVLPHLHPGVPSGDPEGAPTEWRRSTLLVLAIALHNIPEGLAVGVAFGAAAGALGGEPAAFGGAVALALGIGLQNIPEGIAVALPLRGEGLSRWRSLWYGQLSAVVEPIGAVIGAAAILLVAPVLPYALAFAAGAMVYVVVEELVPSSHAHGNGDVATLATLLGFVVMMMLDVALG